MNEQNEKSSKGEALKPLLKFLGGIGGRILLTVIFYVVILLLLGWIADKDWTPALFVIIPLFGYFGWKTLNKFTPDMIIWFHGITAMIIFYFIKGMISLFIGIFVGPFYMGKAASNAIMKAIYDETT